MSWEVRWYCDGEFQNLQALQGQYAYQDGVWTFKFSEYLKGNAYVMAVHGSLAKLGNALSLQRDQSRRNRGDCLPRTEARADAWRL